MIANHDRLYRENLGAYALGALDGDESRMLEEHLEDCLVCQAELADYMAVSKGLLSALPPREPHPGLRKQLEAHLPKDKKTSDTGSFWLLSRISFAQVGIAVAFVFLLGLNLY